MDFKLTITLSLLTLLFLSCQKKETIHVGGSSTILPIAKSDIIGGMLLKLGRAMGETMAVMLVIASIDRIPDPFSSRSIEELMVQMKDKYTIVFVTHNIPQARRIADELIFMSEGLVIESGTKKQLFDHPVEKQTHRYLTDDL